MRRIITMTLMSLGLASGVALADNHGSGRREQAPTVRDNRGGFQRGFDRGMNRGEQRGGQRQNRNEWRDNRTDRRDDRADRRDDRQDIRFESSNYSGYRYVAAQWQWDGNDWHWVAAHYERIGWGY
jgi:hypothetical protein